MNSLKLVKRGSPRFEIIPTKGGDYIVQIGGRELYRYSVGEIAEYNGALLLNKILKGHGYKVAQRGEI